MPRLLTTAMSETLTAIRDARSTRITSEQTAATTRATEESAAETAVRAELETDNDVELDDIPMTVEQVSGDTYVISRLFKSGERAGRHVVMNGSFDYVDPTITFSTLASGQTRWTAFHDAYTKDFDDLMEAIVFSVYGREIEF